MKTCQTPGCELPFYGKGMCKKCYAADWRAHNQDKVKANAAKDYAKHPDRCKRNAKKWKSENKQRVRELNRRASTGHTPELVAALRVQQGGYCGMPDCGRKLVQHDGPGQRADSEVADHCHSSKAPRALLCHSCNVALGFYERNLSRLSVFSSYVNSHVKGP